jgi:hypothetical protein
MMFAALADGWHRVIREGQAGSSNQSNADGHGIDR